MGDVPLGHWPVDMRAAQLVSSWRWDLLGMTLLSLLGIYLEFQAPFQAYLVPELLPRYSYPFVPNSVPTWTLPVLGIFIPLGVILLMLRVHKNSLEARRAAAGLCLSVAMAYAVTNGIKNGVGGFRPDFVARCWPDGVVTWITAGVPACHPERWREVSEGRKSFPSGHTSMCFAGLAFVSIYLTARLRVFAPPDPNEASMWKISVSLTPVTLAAYVGISRAQDYWHHWEDVVVGAVIGVATASFAWAQKQPLYGATSGTGARFDYAPLQGEGAEGGDGKGTDRERCEGRKESESASVSEDGLRAVMLEWAGGSVVRSTSMPRTSTPRMSMRADGM